jgi:hypothetical protein
VEVDLLEEEVVLEDIEILLVQKILVEVIQLKQL